MEKVQLENTKQTQTLQQSNIGLEINTTLYITSPAVRGERPGQCDPPLNKKCDAPCVWCRILSESLHEFQSASKSTKK